MQGSIQKRTGKRGTVWTAVIDLPCDPATGKRRQKRITAPTKKDKPAKKEVEQAVALIEALACPWDPSRYEDSYEKRLKKIIREKSKGKTIEIPEEDEQEASPIPDLMAALEESLAKAKG